MIARKYTLVIRGDNQADFDIALADAAAQLLDGCVQGSNREEASGYYFESTDDVEDGELPA